MPDPAGLGLGWIAVADVNPVPQNTGSARPKSQKDSPGPPNAVSLWRYFATDRLICRNVQIASTLEQNPYFWCSEVPEFRDIPNIFQNLSADHDGCTTFPILSNLGPSLEALWDSKAPNKGHKTCGNLEEWHLRVTHLGGRGTLQAPRWLGDSFWSPRKGSSGGQMEYFRVSFL